MRRIFKLSWAGLKKDKKKKKTELGEKLTNWRDLHIPSQYKVTVRKEPMS